MDLVYSEAGIAQISMCSYINKILEDFQVAIISSSQTLHTNNLLSIQDEKGHTPLSESQTIAFHHTIAQLLSVATCIRRDIQTNYLGQGSK